MLSDAFFIGALPMAQAATQHSTDAERQVGCVILARDGRLLVSGSNAIPSACTVTKERTCRPEKYKWTEHAERRVLNHAARFGIAVNGGTAIVTYFPCADCARSMVDSGIVRVVAPEPLLDHPRWGASWQDALDILNDAKVSVLYAGVSDVS